MTLEKLTVEYESDGRHEQSEALFNPDKLVFRHAAGWRNAGAARADGLSLLEFTGCQPATLALDLFFDTYDAPDEVSVRWPNSLLPFSRKGRNAPHSVLDRTRAIERLTRPDRETHQPPDCRLRWGRNVLFRGVLTEARTTVTLFLPDGTPVRATVGCSFTARESNLSPANELHSADVAKKYTVQPGDTLMLVASTMYMDARCWRPIARANGLDDPLRLAPGQILLIPKLRD
ncbi:LysM peptidoglycan-binding domain-containing protein [Microbulbifer taiwanensis]|uniref:LysM peptidoglycan-binding domain-containing protein n=1 Tax=Microbulbifer taiwanensis TaxID=986746 RepID=A0ABW1YGH9_9GAMM|nr:LysM peptidoglycan-binding domain-containing protein [Microbulbifer taiwanensis]